MFKDRKRTGDLGEKQAAKFLKKHGYKVLETNYRCPIGGIDIIASDGDTIVFVEVRTRHGQRFGTPEESVNGTKQAKLIKLAQFYMNNQNDQSKPWRIDVVAIEIFKHIFIVRRKHKTKK